MARAATLSGIDPDDEDYDEAAVMFNEESENDRSFTTQAKLAMKKLVQRIGFLGILLCASVSDLENIKQNQIFIILVILRQSV